MKEKLDKAKAFVGRHKKKFIAAGATAAGVAGVFLVHKYATKEEYNITVNFVDDIPADEIEEIADEIAD